MANNNNKDLLKVGGLWKNTDKNGNDCFSGDFTFGTKMLVFKNTFKKQDNEPDFNVFFIAKKEACQTGCRTKNRARNGRYSILGEI